eukprot:2004250-Alexandrium_andersonii.AAC.1
MACWCPTRRPVPVHSRFARPPALATVSCARARPCVLSTSSRALGLALSVRTSMRPLRLRELPALPASPSETT